MCLREQLRLSRVGNPQTSHGLTAGILALCEVTSHSPLTHHPLAPSPLTNYRSEASWRGRSQCIFGPRAGTPGVGVGSNLVTSLGLPLSTRQPRKFTHGRARRILNRLQGYSYRLTPHRLFFLCLDFGSPFFLLLLLDEIRDIGGFPAKPLVGGGALSTAGPPRAQIPRPRKPRFSSHDCASPCARLLPRKPSELTDEQQTRTGV